MAVKALRETLYGVMARFTEQMPFVGTMTHRYCTETAAQGRSLAAVHREALDEFFDLDDGEFRDGDPRIKDFNAWKKATGRD